MLGIKFFIIEIMTFDRIKTNNVASPIAIPFTAEVVTPKVVKHESTTVVSAKASNDDEWESF